jgi:hypothetical protein
MALAGAGILTLGMLGVVGLSSPAGAAPPSAHVCTGSVAVPETLKPGVYTSLSMPPGSGCSVTGAVTITQPVTLGDSSVLEVVSGSLSITAPVQVGPNAVLEVDSGSLNITGSVQVGSNAFFGDNGGAAPITVGGSLSVQSNGVVVIGFETPHGPLLSTIGGRVSGNGAASVQIHNSSIGGPINLQGGGGGGFNFNDLEDNVISGPVTINNYVGVWAGVIRNQIAGGLTFTNNSNMDEFDIGSNVIAGNANCSGNNPAVNTGGSPGAPNTVAGGHNTCG